VGLAFAVEAATREAKMESSVEEGERTDRGDEDCFLRRRLRGSGRCVEQPGSDRDDNGGQAIKVTRVPRKSRSIHWKGPKSKVLDAVGGGELDIECTRRTEWRAGRWRGRKERWFQSQGWLPVD
jgi:hypothetical protein